MEPIHHIQHDSICDLRQSKSHSPYHHQYQNRSRCQLIQILLLFSICTTLPLLVNGSGFFELQFLDGVHNSTTIHVCLKEFWNSQINFNRCTFGQKTIIYNEQRHPRQSAVKIQFSFRWIVSVFHLFFLSPLLFSHCFHFILLFGQWWWHFWLIMWFNATREDERERQREGRIEYYYVLIESYSHGRVISMYLFMCNMVTCGQRRCRSWLISTIHFALLLISKFSSWWWLWWWYIAL